MEPGLFYTHFRQYTTQPTVYLCRLRLENIFTFLQFILLFMKNLGTRDDFIYNNRNDMNHLLKVFALLYINLWLF
jgi:hypothetical protein